MPIAPTMKALVMYIPSVGFLFVISYIYPSPTPKRPEYHPAL